VEPPTTSSGFMGRTSGWEKPAVLRRQASAESVQRCQTCVRLYWGVMQFDLPFDVCRKCGTKCSGDVQLLAGNLVALFVCHERDLHEDGEDHFWYVSSAPGS
jgi:hypothetical protein